MFRGGELTRELQHRRCVSDFAFGAGLERLCRDSGWRLIIFIALGTLPPRETGGKGGERDAEGEKERAVEEGKTGEIEDRKGEI